MDDILDLNFNHHHLKSNQPSSTTTTTTAFDHLSNSILKSSTSPSPNYHHQSISTHHQSKQQAYHQPKPQAHHRDAFSSIFDHPSSKPSSSSNPQPSSNLTLSQQLQSSSAHHHHPIPSSSVIPPTSSQSTWDFDLLDQPQPQPPPRQLSPPPSLDSSFARPTTIIHPNHSGLLDPFSDFDPTPIPSNPSSHTHLNPSHSDSLLGHEFGPVETPHQHIQSITSTTTDPSDSSVEILGLLATPIDQLATHRIKSKATQLSSSSSPSSQLKPNSPPTHHLLRSKSSQDPTDPPPPHLLAQLVEIGFCPALSRKALTHTRDPNTGHWDLSSAIDNLLITQPDRSSNPPDRDLIDPLTSQASRHQPLRTVSHDGRFNPNSQPKPEPTTTSLSGLQTKELQDQAVELLAQASAYGSTALGRAATFWKQSKASLTKAIEDQTTYKSVDPTKDYDSVKPKWMKEVPASSHTDSLNPSPPSSSPGFPFSDRDSQAALDRRITNPSSSDHKSASRQPYISSARRKVTERTARHPLTRDSPTGINSGPSISLFSPQEDLSFSSPTISTTHPSSSKPPATKLNPVCSFPTLPIISVSQQQIQRSETYRNKGNEYFKQGQYGHAEGAYTRALEALQDPTNVSSSSQTIDVYFGTLPVYNNRASARLKNGDGKGAKEDVERVIEIIFCEDQDMNKSVEELKQRLDWNQTRIPDELRSSLNIPEQVGKAFSKRARIHEDFEKWPQAKIDWEICRKLGGDVIRGAGGLKIINESLSRCSQALDKNQNRSNGMMNPITTTTATTTTRTTRTTTMSSSDSRTRSTPQLSRDQSRRMNQKVNEAVQRLRESNERLEIESNQKLESKDFVDDKILRWKSGKESNLRALIASLDSVLWDRLGWSKVNMSELLTAAQVKSKYVKAISKVHPDKIPKDASIVEQMIAKSVFATLNEAWIAMQSA